MSMHMNSSWLFPVSAFLPFPVVHSSMLDERSAMSQDRVFSLVRDSNVKLHMNPTNCRDRKAMVEAQVIPCTKLAVFQQCLRSVRENSDVCIVSCVSNFISDSDSASSSIAQRLDPIYKEFFLKLVEACNAHPARTYFICLPMFRKFPGGKYLSTSQCLRSSNL